MKLRVSWFVALAALTLGCGDSNSGTAPPPPPPPPTTATVATVGQSFSPDSVTIAAGGTVTWTFGARAHNVTFVQNKPTDGDIAPGSGLTNTTAAHVSAPKPRNKEARCSLRTP